MKEQYLAKLSAAVITISKLKNKDTYLSIARLISFLLFFTGVILIIEFQHIATIIFTAAMLLVFFRIILMHIDNLSALKKETDRKEMLQNEIDCLEYKSNLYYAGDTFTAPDHDYVQDMDIFGKNSLFHYINRCATGVGNQILAQWLRDQSSDLNDIEARQLAVKELATAEEWGEELRVGLFGRRIQIFGKEHLPEIKNTIQAPEILRLLIWVSWFLLGFSVTLIIWAGISSSILTIPVLFNIMLNIRMAKFTQTIRAQINGREKVLSDYLHILQAFESKIFQSALLNTIQKEIQHEGVKASDAIARLQEMSKKLDFSLSMIVGAVLNLFFLWDIIYCRKISRWFEEYSPLSAQWFGAVGKIEALISLSQLQQNHPQWYYPQFEKEGFMISGKDMGHPLIPSSQRITNDFDISSPALLSIITGSNMAGKSTFLRTLGVNVILAKAGAPVCAGTLTLSHFRIMTYLTITDSLAESTSTFYREIKRLKHILDNAREDNNILLLLDELLRGTNSADKAKGSIAIARELIRLKVPAVIATHNLELAHLHDEFPAETKNYFFDITIDDSHKMRFDYKLKPGICNTFNASLLLKEIGIYIDPENPQAPQA
jgi:DNA mismatch repair ATPase MutS